MMIRVKPLLPISIFLILSGVSALQAESYRYFRNMTITPFNHPAGIDTLKESELSLLKAPYYRFIFRTEDLVDRVQLVRPDGSPAETPDGIHEWLFSYGQTVKVTDPFGDQEPETIRLDRACVGIATRNKQGIPAADIEGTAFQYFRYDHKARLIQVVLCGVANRPRKIRDGFAELQFKYDRLDRIVERSFFDEQGKPINATRQKIHRIVYTFDTMGNVLRESFYNGTGEPMVNAFGVAAYEYRYTVDGQRAAAVLIGLDGKPIPVEPELTGQSAEPITSVQSTDDIWDKPRRGRREHQG